MKRAFSLIEVLISIFFLSLALLGLAAVFAATTRRLQTNTGEVLGRSARRSGEVLYSNSQVATQSNDWTITPTPSTINGIRVIAFTYTPTSIPPITVTAAVEGDGQPLVSDFDLYVPKNGDVVITWWGGVHTVVNDAVQIQEFEQQAPIVVLPYQTLKVLDVHQYIRIK